MNLRILKKLSKRAAPLLIELGLTEEDHFKAESGDNYTYVSGHDRKHWRRSRYPNPSNFSGRDIHIKPQQGSGVIALSEQYIHPWKGTAMVGWTVGYYEPEWEEATAWDIFQSRVKDHFMDLVEVPDSKDEYGVPQHDWVVRRRLRNPAAVFRAFSEGLPKR